MQTTIRIKRKSVRPHGKKRKAASQHPSQTQSRKTEEHEELLRLREEVLQLREAQKEDLEIAQDLREKRVQNLLQELRGPLNAAAIPLQTLLSYPVQEDSTRRELTRESLKSIRHLEHRIQDLLDAGLVKLRQPLPVHPRRGDLSEPITRAVSAFSNHTGRRVVLVAFETCAVYWDLPAIERALDKLIANALRYGDREGLVTIRSAVESDTARISVHNEGNAIPPEDRLKLFAPFSRLDGAEKCGPGWGIGLSIAKALIEAHQGTLEVASDPHAGTLFSLRLPLDARARAANAPNKPDGELPVG